MTKTIIDILILLIMPFIMAGIIKKTKSFWAGRKGPGILQPLKDFIKLMKKDAIYSETTSYVFKIAPVLNLATVLFAAIFVPAASGSAIVNIPVAFIVFSYVLGTGKFFSLIAALDTGSSFEGMGASREACFSTIVEPAFFIAAGSIAALTGIFSFESFKAVTSSAGIYGLLIIILAVITLFIMMLVECCRVPVDDPATHLELTMIHEAMILDNSGVEAGFITWAANIKMFLFSSLIAALVIPQGLPTIYSIIAFSGVMCIVSIIIGTIESATARFRMTHVFEFIFIMSITALLILTLVTYKLYGN